ncbi:hypothetical protein LSH36_692g03045 [Paralvinella palmiformis]|uniref:Uncharacterized protein n=1 Tax=Paralvinella palmiformis TaxID=53620 RepID=A0AAD9MVE2_9ANNE|nr:hypothetical protein LSH36_692g03045 [Paralvinella palmiformis]
MIVLQKYRAGCYLAARCHYEYREYQEALDVLDQSENSFLSWKVSTSTSSQDDLPYSIPSKNIDSSVNLLRGKIYEALENRNLASECFREALRGDVFCYEAFESLINHHMMTAQEERDLLDSLPFSSQCSGSEIQLLKFLYGNKLKKYSKPGSIQISEDIQQLSSNNDVIVSLAENHYYNCDFRQAYKIASDVLKSDPYNFQCLPLYIVILVELKNSNELFALAHKLVDMYPNKAVSWFATGCYYLLVGKNDPARRYLSKATSVDRVFGPAWLAFGHSFATENEHDQAMAAYFTASQLMKGCHLPVLYIGLEYGLTNNAKLAERFFGQALSIAPEDPFVLHEMGVVAFKNQDYAEAEKCFTNALQKIESVSHEVMVDKWEPLLNNLGHVCRKLKWVVENINNFVMKRVLGGRTVIS